MADSELALKLARRQQRMDESNGQEDHNGHKRPDQLRLDTESTDSSFSSASPDQKNGSEESDNPPRLLHSPISDDASNELKTRLTRRQDILDGKPVEAQQAHKVYPGLYAEFSEFTRKQLKQYEQMFKKYDINHDGFICIDELKLMMEKLGAPQTHLALKQMIREVDEDRDGKINLREFLSIFRKAAAGELQENSALSVFANLADIDVTKEGVSGAKQFFEAKIDQLSRSNAFEAEIRAEQEETRRKAEEKKQRHQEFMSKKCVFQQS